MLTYLANPSPAPRGALPTDRTGLVVLVFLVAVGVVGVIWLRRAARRYRRRLYDGDQDQQP